MNKAEQVFNKIASVTVGDLEDKAETVMQKLGYGGDQMDALQSLEDELAKNPKMSRSAFRKKYKRMASMPSGERQAKSPYLWSAGLGALGGALVTPPSIRGLGAAIGGVAGIGLKNWSLVEELRERVEPGFANTQADKLYNFHADYPNARRVSKHYKKLNKS